MLHTSYAYMPASAPSTSHKVLTKVDTDGAWRRSYTDHMAHEARRRRKGAWGLKCEMREDGIRTERGEGQLYGQKKDVNAWKIRRNKLWSASLAMAMEEREEESGKNLYVRTIPPPSCGGRKDVSSPPFRLPPLLSPCHLRCLSACANMAWTHRIPNSSLSLWY